MARAASGTNTLVNNLVSRVISTPPSGRLTAGILVGGVISLVKQGASRFSIGLVAVLALLATAGGVAWLLPGDG